MADNVYREQVRVRHVGLGDIICFDPIGEEHSVISVERKETLDITVKRHGDSTALTLKFADKGTYVWRLT